MVRKLAQNVGRSNYAIIQALAANRQMRAEDFLHGCLFYTEAAGRKRAARLMGLPPGRLKLALAMAAQWTPSNMGSGERMTDGPY